MHEKYPGVANHFHREAATGEGQFGSGNAGTATHVVTSANPKTGVATVKRASDFSSKDVKKTRISGAKGANRPFPLRIDI